MRELLEILYICGLKTFYMGCTGVGLAFQEVGRIMAIYYTRVVQRHDTQYGVVSISDSGADEDKSYN